MAVHYYSLRNLVSSWARETGASPDVILAWLVRSAQDFRQLTLIPKHNTVSTDDLKDAWLALQDQRYPGHAIWERSDAESFLHRVVVSGEAIACFCREHQVNPPSYVKVSWLGWVRGRASIPEKVLEDASSLAPMKDQAPAEPTKPDAPFALQKRAGKLRKAHPEWTKRRIAEYIADNDKPAKRKGEGTLSHEAIEREIRLPRPKRRTPHPTP